MSDLVDFSFLIIVLAVFGFMLKDAFYFSRKVSIPYEIRDKDDKIFSNVSLGLLIISLIFFFTAQYYLADPQKITEFIQFFFSGLFNLSKEGFITESNLIALIENITIGLYFLSWISFVFFVFFFLAFFFGIIALFFDNIAIEISFKSVDSGTAINKKYRRIISESDSFLYVENLENFRIYEGINKSEITGIKKIYVKTQFDEIIKKIVQSCCLENGQVALFFLNRKYRAGLIIVLLIFLYILISVQSFFPYAYLVYVIIAIPIFILTVIDNTLR